MIYRLLREAYLKPQNQKTTSIQDLATLDLLYLIV